LALALALLWGAVARGETELSRTKRERAVTVVGTSAERLPEIHIAPDTLTWLRFPVDIQKNTLTVDESRIQVVAIDVRGIIVRAADDYRAGERHDLTVFFADGAAPARAAFALVMDPAEVDIRIDVKRPDLPNAACPAEVQREPPRPEDFVLQGYVGERGVQTAVIPLVADSAQGLASEQGMAYRGEGWVLFDVVVSNLPGRSLFSPRDATLAGKGGVTVQARVVTVPKGAIPPGEKARVLAVVDKLPPTAGLVFTLEVRGEDGRSLVIPRVTLPKPVAEDKQ
jgi:uncharacterized protein (TIGR02268 family)